MSDVIIYLVLSIIKMKKYIRHVMMSSAVVTDAQKEFIISLLNHIQTTVHHINSNVSCVSVCLKASVSPKGLKQTLKERERVNAVFSSEVWEDFPQERGWWRRVG